MSRKTEQQCHDGRRVGCVSVQVDMLSTHVKLGEMEALLVFLFLKRSSHSQDDFATARQEMEIRCKHDSFSLSDHKKHFLFHSNQPHDLLVHTGRRKGALEITGGQKWTRNRLSIS